MEDKLYYRWNKFWEKENFTVIGKMMTRGRMKAYKKVLTQLDFDNIIDIGCGYGFVLNLFEDLKLNYVGIDVSENAVAFCKQIGLNARVGKLEDEQGEYDLVEAEGMLEHFLNFEPYVAHMCRISKKYVMILQPNHHSFWGRIIAYLAQLVRGKEIVLEYNYRIEDFVDSFKKYNFKLIKSEPIFLDSTRLLVFESEK